MKFGKTVNPDFFKTTRALAIASLILNPIVYLFVIFLVTIPERTGGETDIMLYILLLVGILQPLTIPLIVRVQRSFWRKSNQEKKNPAKLFFGFSLVKFPIILAIYVYGIMVYLISGDVVNALVFYPIGIAWTIVHWPTRKRFDNFVNKLSKE